MNPIDNRKIFSHIVEGEVFPLSIVAYGDRSVANAQNNYTIIGLVQVGTEMFQGDTDIQFQNGNPLEVGPNGVTMEALLAIVADRLECLQSGKFACPENQAALFDVRGALEALQSRTRDRIARDVKNKLVP